MIPFLWLSACVFRIDPPAEHSGDSAGARDSGEHTSGAVPVLSGVRSSGGALLWTDGAQEGWTLQLDDGDGWQDLRDDAPPWFDPDAPSTRAYRLRETQADRTSVPALLDDVTATLSSDVSVLLAGESIIVTAETTGPVDALELGLMQGDGLWLDASCVVDTVQGCWRTDFVPLSSSTLYWKASLDTALAHDLSLVLGLEDGRGERAVVDSSSLSIVELGRSIAWGDPHAHSNLSQDGCEVYDDQCRSRESEAAADFFEQAVSRGLDFAAITDHAEYSYLYPEGREDEVVIWRAQQAFALEADNGTFLPLIGYEWTNFNGHRSVIFEQVEACGALRVSGKADPDVVVRLGVGDELVPDNAVQALSPADLWAALDEGAKSCATSRILSIPHHTAMRLPEPVVWSSDLNTPDMHYERLVEITSEHGTSECIDLDDAHCDYRIKTIGGYSPEGSIQAMLQEGYHLGFIGGTDSHDSRPGSTDDGPSCVSLEGEISAPCHEYPGGLTGVLYAGTLDRETLFDGLYARNTVAASALPVDVRAALISEGTVYLPGDDVPAGDHTLVVSVPDDGARVLSIEAIDQDGVLRASLDTPAGVGTISLDVGAAVYLRVRLESEGVEERIWVSPFFGL